MKNRKTATLNMRVTPKLHKTLRSLAKREDRSMTNMIEFMILEYKENIKKGKSK